MDKRAQGFAVLIVLWTMVFLAFLMTQILATGRGSVALAAALRGAAEAKAVADGAINEALFHVLVNGAGRWDADGVEHPLSDGASVRVDNLASKINPNLASAALLAGLMQAADASPAQAAQLAHALIQWRSQAVTKQDSATLLAAYRRADLPYGPPGRPFANLGQLSDVIGMPPSLFAKVLPEMSLDQSGDPDAAMADPVVKRALALAGQAGSTDKDYEGIEPVVSITVRANVSGALVRRRAVIGLGGNGQPFHFVSLADDD